jgi:hypothetical protein
MLQIFLISKHLEMLLLTPQQIHYWLSQYGKTVEVNDKPMSFLPENTDEIGNSHKYKGRDQQVENATHEEITKPNSLKLLPLITNIRE